MRWMSAFLKRVVSLAACSLAALAAAVPLARADSPFPNGFWAAPLAADVALDPGSPAIAANIGAQAAKGAGFAVRQWNARIHRVPVDQPKVLVVVDGTTNAHRVLQAALNADGGVPIPEGALPSSLPAGRSRDTDSEMSIYQPGWTDGSDRGTGRLWEFYRASTPAQNAPGAPPLPWGQPSHGDSAWHVRWGGRISYASTSPGHPVDRTTAAPSVAVRVANAGINPTFEDDHWMATATSLPLAAGMVTFDDWNRGVIDHVVGLTLRRDSLKAGAFSWPAQRTDGKIAGALVAEGTRLRLPAGYPINPAAPKLVRMLEQAAKTYGFVVWDAGSTVGIRMEQQQTGNPQGAARRSQRAPTRGYSPVGPSTPTPAGSSTRSIWPSCFPGASSRRWPRGNASARTSRTRPGSPRP